MLFNSHEFILIFLPVALICYFCMNRTSRTAGKWTLLLLSVVFVAFQGIYHAVVAVLSTLINFGIGQLMHHDSLSKYKKKIFVIGIALNVAGLAVFKYPMMFNGIWMLPLGISFYTFQQIAFLVDCYRGTNVGFQDHALFTMFFPKIVQGPIPYANELIPAFSDSSRSCFNFENFSKGVYLFAIGLTKKVMIADKFGIFADYGFVNISSLTSYEALLTILAYTFQLYFDFSGYSDMAVGIARMFNFDLPINFNSPYKAKNISDFWKRWHITLTRFLTKFIYIPLGGNRKGLVRTYLNIFVVYLVSGIWHGTGVTFLVWGLLHGVATVLYRIFKKQFDAVPSVIQWVLTFVFVNITWVFFRADSVSSALDLLRQVFVGGWSININAALTESLLQPTLISLMSRLVTFKFAILIWFAVALVMVVAPKNSNEKTLAFRANARSLIFTYILLVISILSLSGVSSFLYTNF